MKAKAQRKAAAATTTRAPAAAAAAPAPSAAASAAPPLVSAEGKRDGGFTAAMYRQYLSAMGFGSIVLYLLLLVVTYATYLFGDVWLSMWIAATRDADAAADTDAAGGPVGHHHDDADVDARVERTARAGGGAALLEAPEGLDGAGMVGVYLGAAAAHLSSVLATAVCFTLMGVRASRSLHRTTIRRVLYAPLWWYDATPSGRTLSRFTSDSATIDIQLNQQLDGFVQMAMMGLVLVCTIVAAANMLAIVAAIAIFLFALVTVAADRSCREVKRLANNAVSPVLTTIGECKAGAALIRLHGAARFFAGRQSSYVGRWASLAYYVRALQTWCSHACSGLAIALGGATSFFLLGTREERSPELGGLALTCAAAASPRAPPGPRPPPPPSLAATPSSCPTSSRW